MARTAIPLIILDPATAQFIPNAQITVLNRLDSSPATVYQGETGPTTSAQPLLSDASGRVSGWLNRGAYTFQIAAPGHPTRTEYYDSAPASDNSIDSLWIANNAIQTVDIGNNQITTPLIAPNNVTSSLIADNAVGNSEIAAGSVDNSKLAANAVSTNTVQDGAITTQKLAAGIAAGNRTLLGRNIQQFTVDNSCNGYYIYPYYWPYWGVYYYRGTTYMFTNDPTKAGPTPADVTLTHQSTKVRVTVWMGGATSFANADLGLTVMLDGVPQTAMISNTIDHGPYWWWGYSFYYGNFQHFNATQQFTISPGTHTWNLRIEWGSAYAWNAGFVSSGVSLVLIQEEPNTA